MIVKSFPAATFEKENHLSFVYDWYTLASVTGMTPHVLSYIKTNPEVHTRRLKLGDRVVYQSSPQLKEMQGRLKVAVENIMLPRVPRTDHMLAYMPGVDPKHTLRGLAGTATAIYKFDIKKYFDHITRNHVSNVFQKYGNMSQRGAYLTAFYTATKGTLQQGSVCSPAISNIVGYECIDVPALAFLENRNDVRTAYVRYCDNIALFVLAGNEGTLYEDFKAHMVSALSRKGFRTHKWSRVSGNNPVRNLSFLGVILNRTAKIEKGKFDVARSELFNLAASPNIISSVTTKCREMGFNPASREQYVPVDVYISKVLNMLQGKVNYVLSVNAKQGKALKKLLSIVTLRLTGDQNNTDLSCRARLPVYVFREVKKYRNDAESVEEYVNRVIESAS